MLIGYCRISTGDQNIHLQKDALNKAGCSKIFEDIASGSNDAREGLLQALSFARKDDCIVIWKLDRLGRSLKKLLEIITDLEKRGIGL